MEDIGTMVVAELHFHLRTVRALNAIPILNIGVVQNMDFAEAPKSIVIAIRVLIFDPWASQEKCDQIVDVEKISHWTMERCQNVMETVQIIVVQNLVIVVLVLTIVIVLDV